MLSCRILIFSFAKIGIIFESNKFFRKKVKNRIDDEGGDPSSDDVDGVVGLDIDGGQTHQHIERHHTPEERFAAGAPGEEHQDGGDADMTAGEGGGGTLARFMGTLYHMVEESVAPTRSGYHLLMGGEVTAYVGEHTAGDILKACRKIIVLWSGDRQEDKDDIVDEECREDDELYSFELRIAAEEIEQRDDGNQWEI